MQKIAINSEATVITNSDLWVIECLESALVTVISRSERSFISKARVQTIRSGLMFNKLPWKTLFSIIAEIKLIVEVKAWKSPVK